MLKLPKKKQENNTNDVKKTDKRVQHSVDHSPALVLLAYNATR